MATLGQTALTLNDHARRQDPNGVIAQIVEILTDQNEILEDMPFMEGNISTGHKTTIRSGLPEPTWRKLNYGVQPSKSRTVQIVDTCGNLEAYSVVDKDLADLNGNTAAFRLSEDYAHLESMNQTVASTIFYGNTDVYPERFMGLAPRYNDLGAENGENILSGGGSGSDNTSIWLVVWGDNTCHGIFPKGKMTGVQHKDLGEDTVKDDNGGEYQAYRTHYKWELGLCLRNWKYVVRIANIDVTELTKDASGSSADLIDLMVQAVELLDNMNMGKAVFYCNKTVRSFLRRQIKNENNMNLNLETVAGKKVVTFDGIPVKRCDAILNTEETVS